LRISSNLNFLINVNVLTAVYFSKARYILFVLKVPLNLTRSVSQCICFAFSIDCSSNAAENAHRPTASEADWRKRSRLGHCRGNGHRLAFAPG